MRRFRGFWSLIIIVLLAVGGLAYTFAVGNQPLLGLDLQGGVSVVLKPVEEVSDDTLEQAISIIRQRVDALGVAEPEITRQGQNILIQIPGVKDRDRALELVGQTAELQFRPVLAVVPAGVEALPTDPTTTPGTGDPTAPTEPTPTDPTATVPSVTESVPATTEQGLGSPPAGGLGLGESAGAVESAQAEAPATEVPVTEAPAPVDAQSTPGVTVAPPAAPATTGLPPDVCSTGIPSSEIPADQPVVLPECRDGQLVASYQLGPVSLTGSALSSASAGLDQGGRWTVNPVFKGGADGIDLFNSAAAQCFAQSPTCPTGQLGIVLDGRVISAPVIQTGSFQADQIQISGTFTEREANDLSTALRYGALPVELEQQQAQVVSATLGQDALRAGLVAGAVGVVLAAAYMIAFYRFLGVLSLVKLAIEAALLWTIISYLGSNNGLALTLAGVTGIIVSIGVSLDSNVVYYEHLKEDVQNGRSIRSASDKSFVSAFSTIVKADVASLIGAGLLWWLTVGPVRGFAFYLALAGILDLIASWACMRPTVKLATRSKWLLARPRLLGLPAEQVAYNSATPRVPATSGADR
ncbi:MAG: protein translocase subunit SecD [Acidimicrobiales bacterium]|nr:protein translocase subunit SecD [Acidimicrobiales bacterium]